MRGILATKPSVYFFPSFALHILCSPDEHPFTPTEKLAKPILPPLTYPRLLHPNNVNVNQKILHFYTQRIVPAITRKTNAQLGPDQEDDDGNYGSVATSDVQGLQAFSRRIHYGGLNDS